MIAFTFSNESLVGKKRHPIPTGYSDIPVLANETIRLNLTLVNKCVGALVKFEGGPFRSRMDGGLPISAALSVDASGYLRGDGDEYFCSREEALRFNVVLDTLGAFAAVSGILRVTYYG